MKIAELTDEQVDGVIKHWKNEWPSYSLAMEVKKFSDKIYQKGYKQGIKDAIKNGE